MKTTSHETPETAALARYVEPAEANLADLGAAVIRNGGGEITRIDIRSDAQYEKAGVILAAGRKHRAAFATFWKDDPGKPQDQCSPGEGMGYFARRMWESANSIFNHFDLRLKTLFGNAREGGLIEKSMTDYRAEVERRAMIEAERKAKAERDRLAAEAQKEREAAEKERKRAEAEAEKRRVAERALAKSKVDKEAADRRAEDAKRKAEEVAAEAKRQAEEKENEAEAIGNNPVVERTAPTSTGATVRVTWKADLIGTTADQREKSMARLITAIAEGRAPARLLELNQRAANDLAGAFGGRNPPDGLAFRKEETTAAKGVRK